MSIIEFLKHIDFRLVLIVLAIIALVIKKYEEYKKDLEENEEIEGKSTVAVANQKKVNKAYMVIRIIMISIAVALLCYILLK